MTTLTDDLACALGEPVAASRSVGGGCIAAAGVVTMASGRRLFVKHAPGRQAMFLEEANGLRELAQAGAIAVPDVVHAAPTFLVLAHIEPGPRPADFMAVFGRQFAGLHRHSASTFGFHEDNFIGATPQRNTPGTGSWTEFYHEYRLLPQLRLAATNGYATPELTRLMMDLEGKLSDLLAGSEEPPSLLHGDLWGGNYMVDRHGAPCLIDPAVYYGHREADLAMTTLFGGFDSSFYAAYNEAWPLPAGAGRREGVYQLYHILNHLNLFGRGYYGQAISLLRQYV
jgi:fructosamine-3-kinase